MCKMLKAKQETAKYKPLASKSPLFHLGFACQWVGGGLLFAVIEVLFCKSSNVSLVLTSEGLLWVHGKMSSQTRWISILLTTKGRGIITRMTSQKCPKNFSGCPGNKEGKWWAIVTATNVNARLHLHQTRREKRSKRGPDSISSRQASRVASSVDGA